jgi:hypothetical protein
MSYDVIGDIHGHAEALEALLHDLGYRERAGAWRHPERQALFVGDLIDRGPKQVETLEMVRSMVDAGSAQAVMGNHELNAIAWFLPDPDAGGDYLRSHHSPKYGEKNYLQHKAFLDAFDRTPRHAEAIDWFLTLPLWLDLPDLRVVHACWHQPHMDFLCSYLTADRCLTADLMVPASREPENEAEKDNPEPTIFKAVEALLKGIEVPLPPPHTFHDKDGHERRRVRVRWWDNEAVTYAQAAMLLAAERAALPDEPIPEHARIGYGGEKPLFVGHYWLTGSPRLLSDTVACLDYSVARGGQLVAYRWDGEPLLDASKFHWVGN